jgi:D-proline reductase (dithiol) PrdB
MTSALDITRAVRPPRAVFIHFPLGHQTGKPNQPDLQRNIVRDALRAFETIEHPGEIVELPYVWDANDRSWEDRDYTPGFMPTRPSRESADAAETERIARYQKN